MENVEDVKFKRYLDKEENKHFKPKTKSIGSILEATEMSLKWLYIPCFLFGIIFGPTIIGTIFLGLFFASYFTSQVIGTSIKDEFKDSSDKYQKTQFKEDVKKQTAILTNTRQLQKELDETNAKIKKLEALKQARNSSVQTATKYEEGVSQE